MILWAWPEAVYHSPRNTIGYYAVPNGYMSQ